MRSLLAASLLYALTACSSADDKKAENKEEPKPAKISLKVGDPAPALKASKWLNGKPVIVEPGKVYVFDFWATWCGPCIQVMPHLAELQREHGQAGLVVVPVTTVDERNSSKRIEEFVAKKGPKLGVPFALCETRETDEAFMKAAEQDGIPCSFVVDKQGKVAFIGHPMELDDVLPKVLAGTWKGQSDLEEIQKMREEFGSILEKAQGGKAIDALKDLAAFESKYPAKTKQAMFQVTKVALLAFGKKLDEAKTLTEELTPKLVEKKNIGLLNNIRMLWTDTTLNPDKKHVGLAVTAAEAVLKIEGEKDPLALAGVADAKFVAGEKAKAIELTEKAIASTEEADIKRFLEQQLKKYKGDGK